MSTLKLSGNMVAVEMKSGVECEIVNYFDVWGNAEEGYEVNNQCVEETGIYVSYDDGEDAIIQKLVDMGLLKDTAVLGETVNLVYTGDFWEIEEMDGYPLFSIRPIYE